MKQRTIKELLLGYAGWMRRRHFREDMDSEMMAMLLATFDGFLVDEFPGGLMLVPSELNLNVKKEDIGG